MGVSEIEAFLNHLAVKENVVASTQNQALSALLFLYREVLHKDLDASIHALRAKKPKRLPAVLTKEEVHHLLDHLSADPRSGAVRRHHLHESGLQKAVRAAARASEIPKKVSC